MSCFECGLVCVFVSVSQNANVRVRFMDESAKDVWRLEIKQELQAEMQKEWQENLTKEREQAALDAQRRDQTHKQARSALDMQVLQLQRQVKSLQEQIATHKRKTVTDIPQGLRYPDAKKARPAARI